MTIPADQQTATDSFQLSGSLITNILDKMSEGFIAVDADWRLAYINRVAAGLFSARVEKLIGQQIPWEGPNLSELGESPASEERRSRHGRRAGA